MLRPAILCCLAAFAFAAEPIPWPQTLEVPRLAAAPADAADPAWATAALIPDFAGPLLEDGTRFAKPIAGCELRLGWTPEALHLRFAVSDDDGWSPGAKRDGELFRGDCVEVFLDPVGDALALAEFQVAPGGAIFDQQILLTTAPRYQPDGRLEWAVLKDFWAMTEWNCAGIAAVTTPWPEGKGWTCVLTLPAKPLLRRLDRAQFAPMSLKANFARYDWRPPHGADDLVPSYWSPVLFGCPHFSHGRMGTLRLVEAKP
jgi:hypothetical protein